LLFFFSDFSSPYAHQNHLVSHRVLFVALSSSSSRTDSFFRFFVSVVDVALSDFSFFSFFSFFSEDFSLVFPMLLLSLRYRRPSVNNSVIDKALFFRPVRRFARPSSSARRRPSVCVVEVVLARLAAAAVAWRCTCLCVSFLQKCSGALCLASVASRARSLGLLR
jgi:hypothetical protein